MHRHEKPMEAAVVMKGTSQTRKEKKKKKKQKKQKRKEKKRTRIFKEIPPRTIDGLQKGRRKKRSPCVTLGERKRKGRKEKDLLAKKALSHCFLFEKW